MLPKVDYKDSGQVKISKHGEYACNICPQTFTYIEQFKKHVFYFHDDFETSLKYNKSVKYLIGSAFMNKIHKIFLNQLNKSELD
jgi:hypothetical protein